MTSNVAQENTLVQRLHELERRNLELLATAEFGREAMIATDPTTLFHKAAAAIRQVLDADAVTIAAVEASGAIRVMASDGVDDQTAANVMTTVDLEALVATSIASAPGRLAALIRRNDQQWEFVVARTASPRAFTQGEIEFVLSITGAMRLAFERSERQQRAIADVEGRFNRVFQSCPVALAMTHIDDGRFLDVNERWLSLMGFQRDDVIGRTGADLKIAPANRDAVAARARAHRVVRDAELRVRTRAADDRDVIVSAVPLDNDPENEVWISALVDITLRKRAEAERDQLLAREQVARAEAEQALEKLRAVYAITDRGPATAPAGGDLLTEVLGRLRETLQVDHATVLLLDDERKVLTLRAMQGPEGHPLPPIRVPIGEGASGRIAAENRAMIFNDYTQVNWTRIQASDVNTLRRTMAVMGAPFHIDNRVAGVVMASVMHERQFTEAELKLLLLAADRVGPAIERGRLIERIRTGIQRQRSLSRKLLTAQEEERRRVAVELHDELGQALTAVKINLASLAQAGTEAGASSTMVSTIRSVDEALSRVRDLALDLRPSVLDDLGLAAALRWYVDRFARAGRIEPHLSIDTLPALEPELETACFRIVQEALTNVDRHAKASRVWLDLHVLDGALELSVRDDGIGFDVAAARARAIGGASVGLLGMQERVSLMGGELEIVQVAGGGTAVRVRFVLGGGSRP